MNIQFRQGSEEVSKKVLEQAQTKILKLSRLISERNFESQVHVDIDRESGSNNSESMWRASINLDMAGERMNASETGSTQEAAVDLAIKELKRELKNSKQKRLSVQKREQGFFKRLLRRT